VTQFGPELAPGSRRGAEAMQTAAVKGRSLWDDARRRLFRNRAALVSLVVLGLLVVAAIVGPYLTPYPYDQVNKGDVWVGPLSGDHLIGTDSLGRDLLARLLIGLRVSLAVGVVATCVSLIIGVAWGAVAGYLGGKVDELMMRFVDVLYSLPFIFFVILLMVTFGRNFILMFVAIGAVEWLTMARIVRGQTLSLKQKEFVEAARAAGLSTPAIVFRHIVPNLLGPVVVYVTLTIPAVILAESFLSFLGLGVQEPLTSLGTLISKGAQDMELAPWLLIFPSIVMVVTLMCFNFIGDGLRDAIDPKDR
jgi:oligopeptide transport system permease protein